MTKIITVHGTNAGDPSDRGDQWWQNGSEFQEKLSSYLETSDGRLTIEPFHWSGENSEIERRNAGDNLRAKLVAAEQDGEPFAVVGHSHGGSVTAHGLFSAYAKKISLSNMKAWMTVGTPFIHLKREAFFMNRFNIWGQITILAIFTAAITIVPFMVYDLLKILGMIAVDGVVPDALTVFDAGMAMLANAFMPIVLIVAIFMFTARSRKRSSMKHLRNFKNRYARSWISLRHPNDEAITGLGAAKSVDFKLLPFSSVRKAFTVAAIFVAALYLMVADLLYSAPVNPALKDFSNRFVTAEATVIDDYGNEKFVRTPYVQKLLWHRDNRDLITGGLFDEDDLTQDEGGFLTTENSEFGVRYFIPEFEDRMRYNRLNWLEAPLYLALRIRDYYRVGLNTVRKPFQDQIGTTELGYILGRLIDLAAIYGYTFFFAGLAGVAAIIFSFIVLQPITVIFNRGIVGLMRDLAYGNDSYGEKVTGVTENLVDIERLEKLVGPIPHWQFLPDSLSDELSKFTERYATETLARMRKLLGVNFQSTSGLGFGDSVGETLSWKELIHTAYFDVDNFTKLLAVALCDAGLAKPSETLLNDTDYETVRGWYAEMKPEISQLDK